MDDLDQQLIALLRADARASVATLAHKLGVSRGTVTNRIAKLEADPANPQLIKSVRGAGYMLASPVERR